VTRILIISACLLLSGCTPAGQQTAQDVINVAEGVCVPVVSAIAPGDQALCVVAAELADAVLSYAEAHGNQPPMLATTPDGKTVVPPEMHAFLAAKASVKMRKAVKVDGCAK
jgi:hypothetical protein